MAEAAAAGEPGLTIPIVENFAENISATTEEISILMGKASANLGKLTKYVTGNRASFDKTRHKERIEAQRQIINNTTSMSKMSSAMLGTTTDMLKEAEESKAKFDEFTKQNQQITDELKTANMASTANYKEFLSSQAILQESIAKGNDINDTLIKYKDFMSAQAILKQSLDQQTGLMKDAQPTTRMEKMQERITKGWDKMIRSQLFWKMGKGIGRIAAKSGNIIMDIFKMLAFMSIFDPSGKLFTSLFNMIVNIGVKLITMIADFLPKMVIIIAGLIPKIITTIAKALPKIMNAIANAVVETVKAIIVLLPMLFKLLTGVIVLLVDSVLKVLPDITKALVAAFPQLIDSFILIGKIIIQALIKMVPEILGTIGTMFDVIASKSTGALKTVFEFFSWLATGPLQSMIMWALDNVKIVLGVWIAIIALQKTSALIEKMKAIKFLGIGEKIGIGINKMGSGILTGLGKIGTAIKSLGMAILGNPIALAIIAVIAALTALALWGDKVASALRKAQEYVTGFFDMLGEFGKVLSPIRDLINGILDAFSKFADGIFNIFQNFSTDKAKHGLMTAIGNILLGVIEEVIKLTIRLQLNLIKYLSRLPGMVFDSIVFLTKAVWDAIGWFLTNVPNLIGDLLGFLAGKMLELSVFLLKKVAGFGVFLFKKVKEIGANIWKMITNFFTGKDKNKQKAEKAVSTGLSSLIQRILSMFMKRMRKLLLFFPTIITKIFDGMRNKVRELLGEDNPITKIFDSVTNTFQAMLTWFKIYFSWDGMKFIFNGLIAGIKESFSGLGDYISSLIGTILKNPTMLLLEGSRKKLMEMVGEETAKTTIERRLIEWVGGTEAQKKAIKEFNKLKKFRRRATDEQQQKKLDQLLRQEQRKEQTKFEKAKLKEIEREEGKDTGKDRLKKKAQDEALKENTKALNKNSMAQQRQDTLTKVMDEMFTKAFGLESQKAMENAMKNALDESNRLKKNISSKTEPVIMKR